MDSAAHAQATLPKFHGDTFDPVMDYDRLTNNRQRLMAFLLDGEWHPNHELVKVAGMGWRRRITDLRELGFEIESRRKPSAPASGVWQYRLVDGATAERVQQVLQD